jgi:hypothetical protein
MQALGKTTLPERAVDTWVAAYLASEFSGVSLWAPTQRTQVDFDISVERDGKLFVLEQKAPVYGLREGDHRLQVDVGSKDGIGPKPARRSSRPPCARTARRKRTNPVSYTLTATTGTSPERVMFQHFCPPASPRGLLEPDARKPARPVLKGAAWINNKRARSTLLPPPNHAAWPSSVKPSAPLR